MQSHSSEQPMHPTEDSRDAGLPGQATALPEWQGGIAGVQATNGHSGAIAGAHTGQAPANAIPHSSGTVGGPVRGAPGIDDGFLAKLWVPHPYQQRGIEHFHNTEAALFFPPGLGKSSVALSTIVSFKEAGIPHRTLLLAPLLVCLTTWVTEPKKWRQFQGLKIGFAHGPDKERVMMDMSYDIVVMNYDGIAWATELWAKKSHKFDILLCDELTRLKNTASKRYKAIKPWVPSFKIRWGLTGTPIANGYMDLFGQVYILDMGARLGKYITHFRAKYFYQKPYDKFRYYITPTSQEKINDKLKDLALYVSPEDWLQLPELMYIPQEADLPPATRKQYDQLEQDFIIKLKTGAVTAANAGVLTSKLRQFTGGAVYMEDRVVADFHDTKLDMLENLVEGLNGEPVIVAYQFDHEMERIKKRFPNALVLKGGMSDKATTATVEAWNSGNVPMLLVQPASVAFGVNMQFGGSTMVWYTLTYNLEEFIQMIKRLHRQGQEKPVMVYLLMMKKTIDYLVHGILMGKDATQESFFKALKLYYGEE